MKLTFAGTRGYIDARSRRHRRHAALLIAYHGKSVMIDCGEDWAGRIADLSPKAIVITHAHPDHAAGLAQGAPCPVYATAEAWEDMASFPIEHKQAVELRKPFEVSGIGFEAFRVEHSMRCPAVGYRVSAGINTIFYVPDLVYIDDRAAALRGARLYIGDGAALDRSMVRKRGDRLIGHTPVRTQLTWCQKEGVPEMYVTHCGSGIVSGDERRIRAELNEWAEERGVKVAIAVDGMALVLDRGVRRVD